MDADETLPGWSQVASHDAADDIGPYHAHHHLTIISHIEPAGCWMLLVGSGLIWLMTRGLWEGFVLP